MPLFPPASSGSAPTWTYVSQSSTLNPAVMGRYYLLSGASFTITLPTAVGVQGQQIAFEHGGTNLTQVYTFNTTSAQTINGVASGSYAFYTNKEGFTLISDGSNWQISDRQSSADWTNGGANTITAVTTAPVQTGNTKTTDIIWWRRVGTNMEVRIEYVQTAAGTNTGGSGDYLFLVPSTIDTTKLTAFGGVSVGTGAQVKASNSVGSAYLSSSTATLSGSVFVYDSTHVRMGGVLATLGAGNTNTIMLGSASANFTMTVTSLTYTASFTVPISGWQP